MAKSDAERAKVYRARKRAEHEAQLRLHEKTPEQLFWEDVEDELAEEDRRSAALARLTA